MATKKIDTNNLSGLLAMCENYAPGYSAYPDMMEYPVSESRYEFVYNLVNYIANIDETGQDEVADFVDFMVDGFGTMPFLHLYFMSNSLIAGGLYGFVEAEKNLNADNEASVLSLFQTKRFNVNSNTVYLPEFEKEIGLFAKSATVANPYHVSPILKMNYSYSDASSLGYFPSLVDASSEYETLRKAYAATAAVTALTAKLTDSAMISTWNSLGAPYTFALMRQSEYEGALQYAERLSVSDIDATHIASALTSSTAADYITYIEEFLTSNTAWNSRNTIRTELADLCVTSFNNYINGSELSDDEAEGSLGVYDGTGTMSSETFGISRMLDSFSIRSSSEIDEDNALIMAYVTVLKYGLGYAYSEISSSIAAVVSYISQTVALHSLISGLADALAADARFKKGFVCL